MDLAEYPALEFLLCPVAPPHLILCAPPFAADRPRVAWVNGALIPIDLLHHRLGYRPGHEGSPSTPVRPQRAHDTTPPIAGSQYSHLWPRILHRSHINRAVTIRSPRGRRCTSRHDRRSRADHAWSVRRSSYTNTRNSPRRSRSHRLRTLGLGSPRRSLRAPDRTRHPSTVRSPP